MNVLDVCNPDVNVLNVDDSALRCAEKLVWHFRFQVTAECSAYKSGNLQMKSFVSMLVLMTVSSSVFGQHYRVISGKKACNGTATASMRHVVHTSAVRTAPAAKDIVDTAVGAGSFKTLVAAVKAAGLAETLKGKGPFTVFAPTDEAFAKLPAGTVENLLKPENKDQLVGILTYHVVAGRVAAADVVKLKSAKTVQGQEVTIEVTGGKVKVDSANVVKTDIVCSNGIIHVIDQVILPSAPSAPAADIVDTAVGAGSFKTLVAAVQAAELVETLKGKGPFTVFAPSDEAFAKLPEGTVAELVKPENKAKLTAILTYHVVPGRLTAADVLAAETLKTVNGKEIRISTADGPQVNGAKIVATDIECANGIIHVIDTVILP